MSHCVHNCNLDLFPCFCESKLRVQSLDSLLYIMWQITLNLNCTDYCMWKLLIPVYVNLFYYFNKLLFRFSKKLIFISAYRALSTFIDSFHAQMTYIITSMNTLICMDMKVTMCMLTYPFKVQITHNLKVHVSHACQMCVTHTQQRQKHTWYQTMHVHTCKAHLFN